MGFISVSCFHLWKPRSCTETTELKTLTPQMLLEMNIYLVLLMNIWVQHSNIDNQERQLCGLERGLCNSNKNH